MGIRIGVTIPGSLGAATPPSFASVLEVDVLFVGAGPATLASAIHLMQRFEAWNLAAEAEGRAPIEPPSVLVLEKSANVGDHMLSGACRDPDYEGM